MPKVSVIVPVYNVERFLERCVQSLRNQTLQDIEIILVDDQSPDNCPQMCDFYAQQDARIKVVHKKNAGLGYARNSGMEVATGEYIAFVDSDDYVDLNMFEQMYSMGKKYNVDIVKTECLHEDVEGKVLDANKLYPLVEGIYKGVEMHEKILYPQLGLLPEDNGDKYISCSVCWNIYKADIIRSNMLRFASEREFISEDMLFNLEFLNLASSAYVLNRKFYHYTVNLQSLTQKYKADRFEKELVFYQELQKRLKILNLYEYCALRLSRHLLGRTQRCIRHELCNNPSIKNGLINTKRILNCSELKAVFENYPMKKMPWKYYITYRIMKKKLVFFLYFIRKKL